jgi:hypothetical protein
MQPLEKATPNGISGVGRNRGIDHENMSSVIQVSAPRSCRFRFSMDLGIATYPPK